MWSCARRAYFRAIWRPRLALKSQLEQMRSQLPLWPGFLPGPDSVRGRIAPRRTRVTDLLKAPVAALLGWRRAVYTKTADGNIFKRKLCAVLPKKGEPSGERERNITEEFPLLAVRLMDHYLNAPNFGMPKPSMP